MKKEIILPVEIGGVKFKNPFFVASGPTTKSAKQLIRIEETGWAGASIKLTIDPAPYINRVPRYALFNDRNALAFTAEKRLKLDQGLRVVEIARKHLKELILFANITYAGDAGTQGWVNMAKKFEEVGADIIELNMCCPNMSYNLELTSGDFEISQIQTGASLGQQENVIAEIVREIKKEVNLPLFVKLTPEGGRIGQIAKVLYDAGADAVGGTANRLGIPKINLENPGKAVYHLQDEISMSCHAGAWLKPLAQRDTYEIRKISGPDHKIMATGGIRTAKDAIEMIMCGADLLGICSETLISGYDFIEDVIGDMKHWMDEHGYKDLREMRDLVVPEVKTAPELTLYKGYAQIKEPKLSAPCKVKCPIHVPVQAYVRKVAKKEYREAFDLITGAAPLQSICGLVCNHPCEEQCIRGEQGRSIQIRDIKRFVMEYGKKQGWKANNNIAALNGKKVAVIGSGPAGISNAYYLSKAGYDVTVYEKEQKPGGMLRSHLPSFRLPLEEVDKEIDILKSMGVKIVTSCTFGRDITLSTLKEDGFDSVFLAIGANKNIKLNLEGEATQKVINAQDFLKKIKEDEKITIGDVVVVLGGGYAAVDAARTSLRLGAKKVYVAYKGLKEEMNMPNEEIKQAEDEGVEFIIQASPEAIVTQEGHINCIKMFKQVLYQKNNDNKMIESATFTIDCDTVIEVNGQRVETLENIETENGIIKVNPTTLETSMPGVYAGGDAIGNSSVISSAAAGYKAAAQMDKYMKGDQAVLSYNEKLPVVDKEIVLKRHGYITDGEALNLEKSSAKERIRNFDTFMRVMTEEDAVQEASRCLACGCGEGCGICMSICSEFAIKVDSPDIIKINDKKCVACGMCFHRCPIDNIEMINLGVKV